MRQSLTAALAAWAVFGIGLLMWPQAQLLTLTGLVALALSALWVAHVAAFAARAREERRVELAGRRRGRFGPGAAVAERELRLLRPMLEKLGLRRGICVQEHGRGRLRKNL